MTRTNAMALLGLALATTGAGCTAATDHGGSSGVATAVVTTDNNGFGLECFAPSCGFDWPLMSGTTETVTFRPVAGGRLPLVFPSTTDSNVIGVDVLLATICTIDRHSTLTAGDHYDECLAAGGEPLYEETFTVIAGAEGEATLALHTKDGAIYDQFPVSVRQAARLEVQLRGVDEIAPRTGPEYATVGSINLAGTHEYVRAIAFDADDQRLFATHGLTLELRDPTVARFYGEHAHIDGYFAELWPMSRGSVTLDVTAPTASVTTIVNSN